MIFRLAILLGLTGAQFVFAQDRATAEPPSPPTPDQAAPPVKPTVEKIDATHFKIGKVTFDQKSREIRFPAKINIVTGQLEFLVVHVNGKVHESLFVTDVSATHLNLAFTLLRYPPSPELYALPSEAGGLSGDFPVVPAEIKSGARIAIEVEWKDNEKTRRISINDWIQHATTTKAMPLGPWIYGASVIEDGKYVPEFTGDIIAIFLANSAMINYPGDDNGNDDVWIPFPKRVPAVDTEVTVILSPFNSNKTASKP